MKLIFVNVQYLDNFRRTFEFKVGLNEKEMLQCFIGIFGMKFLEYTGFTQIFYNAKRV